MILSGFFSPKRMLACSLALILLSSGSVVHLHAQTTATASFTGNVTTAPQVDATNFFNSGKWNITSAPYPYRTANTLNYENKGVMTCSVGWEFDFGPTLAGVRGFSSTFTNENNGVINAVDDPAYGSFILVSATNIVNKGSLNAGAAGKIQLMGKDVILNRSRIQIEPIQGNNFLYNNSYYYGVTNIVFTIGSSNFVGDVGVYDQGWGLGTNYFNPQSIARITEPFTNLVYSTNVLVSVTNVAQVMTNGSLVFTNFVPITYNTTNVFTNFVGHIQTGAPFNLFQEVPCGFANFNFTIPGRGDNFLAPGTNFITASNLTGTNQVSVNPSGTNVITGYADWKDFYVTRSITTVSSNTVVVPTNLLVEAVYVRTKDTNITARIHFTPSPIGTNHASTLSVLLQTSTTNLATLQPDFTTLCVEDTMLSMTNQGLSLNLNPNLVSGCSGPTYRPKNFAVSRSILPEYAAGSPGFGTPTNDVIWNAGFVSNIVADLNGWTNNGVVSTNKPVNRFISQGVVGRYADYSAYVDNLSSEPPPTASPSLTNFPGEVRIYATNLDMYHARIRAEGELLIHADNLTADSTNSVVDCQNLGYDLGSTNGFLHFQNLAKLTVDRFHGTIKLYSETWTNTIVQDFPDGTTNSIPATFHVLVVDATGLSNKAPVLVYNLKLHATNIEVSDQMTVQQGLVLDGNAFTLDSSGYMILGPYLPNWSYTNMPSIKYFTNNGAITVNNNANFGDDGPALLKSFVNRGSITSSGLGIGANYLELSGRNEAGISGQFGAIFQNGIFSNAYVHAGGGVEIGGDNLKLEGSVINSGDVINFSVTNDLSDGGSSVPNLIYCYNGFNLLRKPASGSLLGTTISSTIVGGSKVDHMWAGHDYGSSAAGFVNNAALGTLILKADNISLDPDFYFYGASTNNALYVNTLDVSSLGSQYTNYLKVAGNLVIYFNNAIADASLTNASTSAGQILNGQLNGHLVWLGNVNNTAFGAQSAAVTKNGFELSVGVTLSPSGEMYSNCIIQAATNLANPNWENVYTGVPPFNYTDNIATNLQERFYRVKY